MTQPTAFFLTVSLGLMAGGARAEQEALLQGDWTQGCQKGGALRGLLHKESQQETLSFDGRGGFTREIARFGDDTCTERVTFERIGGVYALGPEVKASDEPGVRYLDLTISRTEGKAQELRQLKAGTGMYDIVKVEGGELFLGKKSFLKDGMSSDKRPVVIDRGQKLGRMPAAAAVGH